jgi:hypothetical protein
MIAILEYELTPWRLDHRRKIILLTFLIFVALC